MYADLTPYVLDSGWQNRPLHKSIISCDTNMKSV